MTAAEIIEQIKQLPPDEKGKIVQYLQDDDTMKLRIADDGAVKEASEAIFTEHAELFRKLAQ